MNKKFLAICLVLSIMFGVGVAIAGQCEEGIQAAVNEGIILGMNKDKESAFVMVDMYFWRQFPYRSKLGLVNCVMKRYNASKVYVMSERNKLIGRYRGGTDYTEW